MSDIVSSYDGEKVPAEEFSFLLHKKKKTCKNKIYNRYAEKYKVEYSEEEWNELVDKLLSEHFERTQ